MFKKNPPWTSSTRGNAQVLKLNISVAMGAKPLLIIGGGSADDRSVSSGARGGRTLTLSCQLSWSSSKRKLLVPA